MAAGWLPLTSPMFAFAVLAAVVLVAPVIAQRLRVPGIVGLIVAGVLLGPGGFGVLGRSGTVGVLAELGLFYVTFQVALGLDLRALRLPRRELIGLGGFMCTLPVLLGSGAAALVGYRMHAAVLIGAWWATHTLVAHGVYERFGLTEDRSVKAAVGGAILANTGALLVLGVVVRTAQVAGDWLFWTGLLARAAVLMVVVMWVLPRMARWFFAGIGQDRSVRFLFVLFALYGSVALAELAGLEGLVGAYLIGLALNRLIPDGGILMERVEFFGAAFLRPIFLVSVGMLLHLRMLGDVRTLGVAALFTLVVILSKVLASFGAGWVLGFRRPEIGTLFSLSVTQGALTLAAVVVGLDEGLIDLGTVHAVVPVILITCVLGAVTANRWAQRLPRPPVRPPSIGECVLVPVSKPESAQGLVRLAALLARPESGTVMPLTVVGPEVSDEDLERSRELAARAESMALSQGAEATGLVRIDGSPSAGMLHTIVEHQVTFMLVGWKGYTGTREGLFGGVIDEIVGRSSVPLAVARLAGDSFERILLSVFSGSLPLARRPGVQLAVEIARRVAAGTGVPVEVLTDGGLGRGRESDSGGDAAGDTEGGDGLAGLLGLVAATVHVDPRRQHVAIGEHARAGDLLVVSVSPTETGLRTAATRIAWAAPESSIIVALDAGVARGGDELRRESHDWEMWVQP